MTHVSFIPLRPDVPFESPHERRDAARNRERLLSAARELVDEFGAEALTMDALACKAKVGKGTVFRRFGNFWSYPIVVESPYAAAVRVPVPYPVPYYVPLRVRSTALGTQPTAPSVPYDPEKARITISGPGADGRRSARNDR